ncbi:MAG TPA: division/cell wall cluster transcriptional repressor MraZ [bacterium]|nr:division/cell wall cluster transcriptional repressor MraZ [bacterium]
MFYGEYNHTVDDKGRVFIPSRFRQTSGGKQIKKLYVTRGLEKCLFVYAEQEWQSITQKFKDMSISKVNLRTFARLFFSGACETPCDKQGRINIPNNLLQYGGISKDVVIIGVSNHFEIWDTKMWNTFSADSIGSYEKLAEELVNLGI